VTPEPKFEHLLRMTDRFGTYEHADGTVPRPEHGYCTDDMARVLVVTSREPSPSPLVSDLARQALRFVADAQGPSGDCRNRRDRRGEWHGPYEVGDPWGRSLWGLGTAAARHPRELVRQLALGCFERGAQQRSASPRSMAFAALGAHEILAVYPGHRGALDLLAGTIGVVGVGATSTSWSWPEPRLSYANAVLPEALIVAGQDLDRPELVHHGLHLLGWLLDRETAGGHLSVVPVGGCGADDPRPAIDQQPIEVAALADACSLAARLTADDRWTAGVASAVAWFLGDNDAGTLMWDPATGGGYDGLRADGPNLNQGAESTLSLISTLQHGRRLVGAGR
jgi:hypothetical protein